MTTTTDDQVKRDWETLGPLLEVTDLPTEAGGLRRADVSEWMHMGERLILGSTRIVDFKHRDSRNYIQMVEAPGIKPCIFLPSSDNFFRQGTFDCFPPLVRKEVTQ